MDVCTANLIRVQTSSVHGVIESLITRGGVPLFVEQAAGAAEAGGHGDNEDGRGGAHQDPNQHGQAKEKRKILMIEENCCLSSTARDEQKSTDILEISYNKKNP